MIQGEQDRQRQPDSRCGAGQSDHLRHAVEGHGLDQIHTGFGQGRQLLAVVVLRLVRGDRVIRFVGVAARADDARDLERGHLALVRPRDIAQETDRPQLEVGERLAGIAEQ